MYGHVRGHAHMDMRAPPVSLPQATHVCLRMHAYDDVHGRVYAHACVTCARPESAAGALGLDIYHSTVPTILVTIYEL